MVPKLDDTQIAPEEVKCRFPSPDLRSCRALRFYWVPLDTLMQEDSEKHPAGNLGESLGVPDHLPLILFHKRYAISTTIKILRTALASVTLLTASLLRSQAPEPLTSSGTQSLAVVVAVLMAAVVVTSRVVVLLVGKTREMQILCQVTGNTWVKLLRLVS